MVALEIYRHLMDEGPTFGDSLAKLQRWDSQCLMAAADVREAFWRESGADPRAREACFTMSVEDVRRAIGDRSNAK